jgi:hypothetical protein
MSATIWPSSAVRFRVRGDVVELWPAYEQFAYRIEMFGDEIERLDFINPTSGEVLSVGGPAVRVPRGPLRHARGPHRIRGGEYQTELEQRLMEFKRHGKLLEAQRLAARTRYDVEMIQEVGYCSGIENYTRHLNGTPPGAKPYTLIDYFPDDYLLVIDESHATIPQVRAMFNGDRARKQVLVDHGFRLPSALDNRPMRFEEFESTWKKRAVHVGHARSVRARSLRGRSGRADHPPDRTDRSADRGASRPRPGARPAPADSGAGGHRRARAGDHVDQAAGGGSFAVHQGGGPAWGIPAQRDRHAGAGGDSQVTASRGVRCAGRREFAPRRARPAGSVAGCDP